MVVLCDTIFLTPRRSGWFKAWKWVREEGEHDLKLKGVEGEGKGEIMKGGWTEGLVSRGGARGWWGPWRRKKGEGERMILIKLMNCLVEHAKKCLKGEICS